MKHLKIAYSYDVQYYFVDSERDIVPVENTDFTDVAVAVLSDQDYHYIDTIDKLGFGIPIVVILPGGERLPSQYIDKVDTVLSEEMVSKSRCIITAEKLATQYETHVLPPFFGELVEYVSEKIILLIVQAIKMERFLENIRLAAIFMTSLDLIFSSLIFVMPM